MECIHPPNDGTADSAKLITHRLRMGAVVTVDYDLGRSHSLGLTHDVIGVAVGAVNQNLGITQTVTPQHAVPYNTSSSLGITHIVVHAGAFGGGGTGVTPFSAIFDSNAEAGQPVYVVSDTNVDLADNTTNYRVIGLTLEPVLSGNSGQYITEGTITRTDWTVVTGTTLLTPGAVYYLDSTAGKLTSTPTTTEGEHVVAVARAASNTELDIEIAEPILL